MNPMERTVHLLTSLALKGVGRHLEELLQTAEKGSASHLLFLQSLLEKEVEDRRERRLRRNLAGAHFPVEKQLEAFRFEGLTGISEQQLHSLLDFRWIDRHENLLVLGPPGLGKTHLAIGLGIRALTAGYSLCFERMANLVKLLKTAEIQRSSAFRIHRILRSHVLVIDEIGYTPIDRKEANLFFNLVSELYERASIVITSNKSFSEWAELMGDEVLTTAMLDRLLHHAQVYSLDGESYRIRHREDKDGDALSPE